MIWKRYLILSITVLGACVTRANNDDSSTQGLVATPDPKYHETLFADEAMWIQKSIDAATKNVDKATAKSRDGVTRRDAHPKAHGCVQATFKVDASRPSQAKFGVFATENSFPAWVRFSNAASVGADKSLDARGIAIKLMNVPGKKLIPEEIDETTQDFLLVNDPVFPARDIKQYVGLLENTPLFLATHPREAVLALRAVNHKIETPLQQDYFSMSSFRLGESMVKYRATPCALTDFKAIDKSDTNFLRHALATGLAAGTGCFRLQAQFFVSDDKTPIEDASIEWKESAAPFVNVATLEIPSQKFDTPHQDQFCENLSFTPWHSLAEHKPLGNLNRARLSVYRAISEKNGIWKMVHHEVSQLHGKAHTW